MATSTVSPTPVAQGWLNYRTIWRWHFYAGLFCIPFIIWLSITGSIFLFKPQIERLLDRPYDHLALTGPHATAEAQVQAALAAVPGSNLHYYELPTAQDDAVRVIVGKGRAEYRVYVQPQTLQILHVVSEDDRPMKIVSRLHGELMIGDRGSMLVEVAASWAIVMVVTGLYLWWPRQATRLAGILYIRVRQGQRIFWRDLHAVTGIWISAFALFLLFTGLPWAKSWGGYLKKVRSITSSAPVKQDWTTGRSSELAAREAMNSSMPGMDMGGMDMSNMSADEHAAHMAHMAETKSKLDPAVAFEPLDRLVATVAPLGLAYPVLISPPKKPGGMWTAKSDAQNRRLRTTLTLNPTTAKITKREDFSQRGLIDRISGTGIAAHEGQLFGLANQLLGLFTAMGLVLISVSAVVLWWRRRATGLLGAPIPTRKPRFSWTLALLAIVFGVYLPMLGGSLLLVLFTERVILRRIPPAQRWLGLSPA